MVQRRLICLSSFLLVICTLHAQVNLQTGSATFSLPMFNWQDTKSRLNTVVALSYSSGSGLKVNEVASNVGQGWNLVAGGVITRMQVGEPDDQKGFDGNSTEKDIRKYPNGYLYTLNTNMPPGKGCPEALTKYPIYGGANQVYKQHNSVAADRQVDYFSFQFNGKAGMFVLSTAGGVDHGVMLGDTKMQITFLRDENLSAQGIRTTITSFTIRDVDGLIYKFSLKGLTKVLESNYCDDKLGQRFTQPTMKEGGVYHQAGFENTSFVNPWVVGSWYLTEIEDAFTGRKILFNYGATRDINNVAGEDISYDQWHKYVIITHKTSISKTPVLTSIATPDGHTVAFEFGKNRIDLAGGKR